MGSLSFVLCLIPWYWLSAAVDAGEPSDVRPRSAIGAAVADGGPAPAPAEPPAAKAGAPVPVTAGPSAASGPGPAPRLRKPPPGSARAAHRWLKETASYRVTVGLLGQVAEATLSYTPGGAKAAGRAQAPWLVHAVGAGHGAVLGLARTQKRIESEFDARAFAARRWTNVKITAGRTTVDTAEQAQAGTVALVRRRTGEPERAESFNRASAVLDPLSFLLRLRMALPEAPTTYEVLDGRALWLAQVSAARPAPDAPDLLRVDGRVNPIYWNGDPDSKRTSRSFALYFARDRFHTPVRLAVPFALGEFRAELVDLDRSDAKRGKARKGRSFCGSCRQRMIWRGFMSCWSGILAAVDRGAGKQP
ncbi:MAG: DUF3108 domain-containing protein [Deltaproteobacteria bacterium]|nr:DUF3108 domain-containing protein [Deltaproteobacteria bacterium]